jgi:hypothetical protein
MPGEGAKESLRSTSIYTQRQQQKFLTYHRRILEDIKKYSARQQIYRDL